MTLLYVFLVVILFLVVVAGSQLASSKKNSGTAQIKKLRSLIPHEIEKKRKGSWGYRINDKLETIPIVRSVQYKYRRRLAILRIGDNDFLKDKAAKYTLYTVVISVVAVILVWFFVATFIAKLVTTVAVVYMLSIFVNSRVLKLEEDILDQQVEMISLLKDEYQATKMVTTSLQEVAYKSPNLVAGHVMDLYNVLSAVSERDSDYAMEEYYKVAPNNHMRKLAGITASIAKDGDIVENGRSQYITSLNYIIDEIREEIIKRKRIKEATSGMSFIALLVIFLAEPLKLYNIKLMPSMQNYFESSLGLYMTFLVYLVVILAFLGARAISDPNQDKPLDREGRWLEAVLSTFPYIRHLMERIAPTTMDSERSIKVMKKAKRKLELANSEMSVNQFYLSKCLWVLAIFVVSFSLQVTSNRLSVQSLVRVDTGNSFTSSNTEYVTRSMQEYEAKVLYEYEGRKLTKEQFVEEIMNSPENKRFSQASELGDKYTEYLWNKLQQFRQPLVRWYDPLLAFSIAATLGFNIPDILLKIRERRRFWQAAEETNSLSVILVVLRKNPRMMVLDLLEWCYRFSSVFKPYFLTAIADYSSGQTQALQKLHDSINYFPMKRLIAKLISTENMTTISEAFDGLESDLVHSADLRKLETEKSLNQRALYGSILSYAPLVFMLIVYIGIPWGMMFIDMLDGVLKVTEEVRS